MLWLDEELTLLLLGSLVGGTSNVVGDGVDSKMPESLVFFFVLLENNFWRSDIASIFCQMTYDTMVERAHIPNAPCSLLTYVYCIVGNKLSQSSIVVLFERYYVTLVLFTTPCPTFCG